MTTETQPKDKKPSKGLKFLSTAKDYSSAIFSGITAASAIAIVPVVHNDTKKALEVLEKKEAKDLPLIEKLKLTWKCYIPTALLLTVNLASLYGVNRAYTSKIASVITIASQVEKPMREFISNFEEVLTDDEKQSIREKIAQKNVDEDQPSKMYVPHDDEIIYRDGYSGRYFVSTRALMGDAINKLNGYILRDGYASLTDFYDLIGLEPTTVSDEVGWGEFKTVELHMSAVKTEDERPCIELNFTNLPSIGFNRWGI